MYSLSNTTIEDLWTVHSVSTVGCSQLVPSTKTLKFEAVLDQQVQTRTTYLTTDYERLSVETINLRRLVMEMKSQMGGICAPHYWPHDPGEVPPPPTPLF